jgi:hypothetical protein
LSTGNKASSTAQILADAIFFSQIEAYIVSMLYTSMLFVVSLFSTPAISEKQPERYWSGKPQAIGIDLSPSFL